MIPSPASLRTARACRLCLSLLCAAVLTGCAGGGSPPASTDPYAERVAYADRLVAKAQEFTTLGRDEDAINLYREAVANDPGRHGAWHNMGILLAKQRRLREAAEAWQQAADAEPTDPRPYTALGLQYQDQGWLPDAAKYYGLALGRDPGYLPALKKAIEVDQLTDNYTDVTLARLRRALEQETDPKWVEFLRRTQTKTLERVSRAGGSTGR